jgi:hypothetical protein
MHRQEITDRGSVNNTFMSGKIRRQNQWPLNSYARFLWLALGLWEDIYTLADAYKSSTGDTRLVLARHILGDFDSLDELLGEFQKYIKREELDKLSSADREKMLSAFRDYHRAVQPSRQSLKEIRNCLSAHRTGEPWLKARTSGVTSAGEWGKWEQYLLMLEARCDLTQWVLVLNGARDLLNLLKDFNLDHWYSTSQDEIRFYSPLLPPGYYARDASPDKSE